jgi:hypothetical protein
MLALVMEGEGSLVIDIVGDAPKGPLPETSTASSSSDASSSGAAMLSKLKLRLPWIHTNSCGAMSSELLWSQWAASVRLSPWVISPKVRHVSRGEEIIPEPNFDEAVVFEEFFTVGLRMPPHHVLTEILLKFRV